MTEQTEQEPIDPIAQCIRWLSFMVVNQEDRRMVQAELESIAAQVRDRDAQIARLSAELIAERLEVIGAIARKEQAQQEAATLRAERDALKADKQHMLDNWVAIEELRDAEAERDAAQQRFEAMHDTWYAEACRLKAAEQRLDAAQQQVATLTALVKHASWCNANFASICGDSQRCSCGLDAALQSTRPQEQP